MLEFKLLERTSFPCAAENLFAILAANMCEIVPSGNSYQADYNSWFEAVKRGLQREERKIILILSETKLIGFFQYYTNDNRFVMEEIQIISPWQGKGVFRALYSFLISTLPSGICWVEAYVNKNNIKSQGILKHLGLNCAGEIKEKDIYHFRGKYSDLLEWYFRIE